MKFNRFTSTVALALVAFVACSEDDSDSGASTATAPNQPAASGGSAGTTGATGAAGSSAAGMSATPAPAGDSAEAPDDDLDLTPSEDGDSTGNGNGAGSSDSDASAPTPPTASDAGGASVDPSMSFFVTSRGSGNGGNFGGLEGADAFCTSLAAAVSPALGAKTWRAYLSTSTVNARDRIGTGPWRNARGVVIGTSVEQLHDQTPGMVNGPTGAASEETYPLNDASTALDETGAEVPGNPVLHDIITGTNLDGTVSAAGTCSDWTSTEGTTANGHSNRAGGGTNPSSWNSSHNTGCGEPPPGANFEPNTVSQGGGRGSIYCFAID